MTEVNDSRLDVDRLFGLTRSAVGELSEFNSRILGLTGHARSGDGHVTAAFRLREGLTDLHIAEEAMSMTESALGDVAVEVINDACADLRRQIVDTVTVGPPEADMVRVRQSLAAARASLAEAGRSLAEAIRESADVMDEIHRRFGP